MSFDINDLAPNCDKCGGTGQIEYPRNVAGGTFGRSVIYRTPDPCGACNGRGFILTEDGEALLEFIQKAQKARLVAFQGRIVG